MAAQHLSAFSVMPDGDMGKVSLPYHYCIYNYYYVATAAICTHIQDTYLLLYVSYYSISQGLRKILNLPEPSAESAEEGEGRATATADDDGEGADSADRAHRSASADGDSAEEEDQGGADEGEMEEAGTAEDEEGVSAEAEAIAAAEGAAEGMVAAGLLEDNEEGE